MHQGCLFLDLRHGSRFGDQVVSQDQRCPHAYEYASFDAPAQRPRLSRGNQSRSLGAPRKVTEIEQRLPRDPK